MPGCPSVAELAALLAEGAPGRPDLEAHLGECAACQRALLALADDTGEWGRWERLLRPECGSPKEPTPAQAAEPRAQVTPDLEPSADLLSRWKNSLRGVPPPGEAASGGEAPDA